MARHYEDTETRRVQVAEAALRTLVEVGVSGFTTKAIASRVGISDGTMFRHFGSKREIVLSAMELLGHHIRAGLASEVSPLVDLEAFFRHRAGFVGSEASVGRLIFSDGLVHLAGDEGLQCIQQWRRDTLLYVGGRLERLHEGGDLAPHLDPTSACMLVQGVLLTFAMGATFGVPSSETLERRIDHAWTSLKHVLIPSSPAGA